MSAAPPKSTPASARAAPMRRVSIRFADTDIQLLATLAANADVSDGEFLRVLIRRAAGDPDTLPRRKHRRAKPRAPAYTIALDPDTRLLLVRAGNLLNQIARALHRSRLAGSGIPLTGIAVQLLLVQDDLHQVGERQLQWAAETLQEVRPPC